MMTLNCFSALKIELSDDLPKQVSQVLTHRWPLLQPGEPVPEYTLQIAGKFSRSFAPDTLHFEADANELSADMYEMHGVYKFSSWHYRIFWVDPRTLRLEFQSDLFARWVYPMRIIPQFIQYMLYRSGFCFFHASGFYIDREGGRSVMMTAASGTGKTLTTLHWLSDGGKIYDDDLVAWKAGKLYATPVMHLNFWSYRYRKNPEALPPCKLQLNKHDARREKFFRLLASLTHGYVTFGCNLNLAEYFPGAQAPAAELGRIVVIAKGPEFRVIQNSQEELVRCENRILGDFDFQHLALLRLAELETLTGFHLLDVREMFAFYRQSIREVAQHVPIVKIEVPKKYSRKVYLGIAAEIRGGEK